MSTAHSVVRANASHTVRLIETTLQYMLGVVRL